MLTIGKNNTPQWELVKKALSGEIEESNPSFQQWLQDDEGNRKLYQALKGQAKTGPLPFDKDNVFSNISDILGLRIHKQIPFYRKNWFLYVAASLFAVASIGLTGYLALTNKQASESAAITEADTNIFDPGTKKAYLLSPQGKTIDLSESFDLENADGTMISNRSEGIVSFQQSELIGEEVELHTICVPKGGEYELLLADGSKVYLNSESQLIFPSRFDGDTRRVELAGEAYFEVKKDARPFIVQTVDMEIEVLGTSFNINAYKENLSAHTTLVEGSLRVHLPDNPKSYLLAPADNLSLDKTSRQILIQEVDTDLYTAWVKGEFVFRNQPLEEIFTQLKRWYKFEIIYEDPSIQTMRFTGSAEKARSLEYLLNQIQSVTDIKYKKTGEKIILY